MFALNGSFAIRTQKVRKLKTGKPFIARMLFRNLNHEPDNMMGFVTPLNLDSSALNFWSLTGSSREAFCLSLPSNPLTIARHLFQRR